MEIQKRKRPDGRGTWAGYLVAEDEHGLWLFTPKGSLYRGESAAGVSYVEVGQGDRSAGVDVLHLAPRNAWWFAAWHVVDEPTVTVDVCLPPIVLGRRLCYIDLEIDLWKQRTGAYGVADEDEFEDACDAGWIDADERVGALEATAELRRRLSVEDPVFDAIGWDKFDRAIDLCLDSLPDGISTSDM